MGEEDNLSDKIRNNIRRIVMFKLGLMIIFVIGLLLLFGCTIGKVIKEVDNASLLDDEILSSSNNEGDK